MTKPSLDSGQSAFQVFTFHCSLLKGGITNTQGRKQIIQKVVKTDYILEGKKNLPFIPSIKRNIKWIK